MITFIDQNSQHLHCGTVTNGKGCAHKSSLIQTCQHHRSLKG